MQLGVHFNYQRSLQYRRTEADALVENNIIWTDTITLINVRCHVITPRIRHLDRHIIHDKNLKIGPIGDFT